MTNDLSSKSFARLNSPPPSGTIQFYDNYIPGLEDDTYTITSNYSITPPNKQDTPPVYNATQKFTIQGPEFAIDPSIVSTVFPPQGGNDQYDQNLPFIVLNDAVLPWERAISPAGNPPAQVPNLPWLALLLLKADELVFPAGTNNPITTSTVSEFVTVNPSILKPTFPANWISSDTNTLQMQSITITGAAFNAVVPNQNDLAYMAHCRGINTPDEGGQLLSVLLANRLALATDGPVTYYAHLVSLEGYTEYLGANATAIPFVAGTQTLMDVQLVSLYNWSFVSQPEAGQSFEALLQGLINSQTATGGLLSLPIQTPAELPPDAQSRLSEGFVPLAFATGSGDQSFAWYRGPFTATVPQPLSGIGPNNSPVLQVTSADALMIYLQQYGIFDMSYASAWNMGRALALANVTFAKALCTWRKQGQTTTVSLAQLASLKHLAGKSLKELSTPAVSRKHFTNMMSDGLGKKIATAMSAGGGSVQRKKKSAKSSSNFHPRDILAVKGVTPMLSDGIIDIVTPIATWLAQLRMLTLVPFSSLVPDSNMLPVESIRFFYLDKNWLDAITAGALSIGISGSADTAVQNKLLPALMQAVSAAEQTLYSRTFTNAASAGPVTGMLIRSQIVPGWPKMIVQATINGNPINVVRDVPLASNIRLCLFDGIPDTVTLAEPYHGLQFGIEDSGIVLRNITTAGQIGAEIIPPVNIPPVYRSSSQSVLNVAATAQMLAKGLGITQIGAGDFAMQMVKAPELQTFPTNPN